MNTFNYHKEANIDHPVSEAYLELLKGNLKVQ